MSKNWQTPPTIKNKSIQFSHTMQRMKTQQYKKTKNTTVGQPNLSGLVWYFKLILRGCQLGSMPSSVWHSKFTQLAGLCLLTSSHTSWYAYPCLVFYRKWGSAWVWETLHSHSYWLTLPVATFNLDHQNLGPVKPAFLSCLYKNWYVPIFSRESHLRPQSTWLMWGHYDIQSYGM